MTKKENEMVDIFAKFDTDIEKETQGAWVDIAGAKFKIASDSMAINVAYAKDFLENKSMLVSNNEKERRDAIIKIMANTILLDWSGVSKDGEEVKYSKESAIELLNIPRFFEEVSSAAGNIENFRREQKEEILKN